MKWVKPVVVLVSLVGAGSLESQEKPPWEWTSAERIARRLDPARGHIPSAETALQFDPRPWALIVDGSRTPELLLPWELIDSFFTSAAFGPNRAMYRKTFEADLALLGWEPSTFWPGIEEIRAPYAAAQAAVQSLLVSSAGTSLERSKSERQLASLHQRSCAARADALGAARRRYEAFDEFLYAAVAPRVVLQTTATSDAATLAWIAGGCP